MNEENKDTKPNHSATQGRTASTCSVSLEYLESVKETLMDGMRDIDQLLSVAKYNLRGEHCGEIVGKPKNPQLIHERGIAASEEVREQMREVFKITLYLIKLHNSPNVKNTSSDVPVALNLKFRF